MFSLERLLVSTLVFVFPVQNLPIQQTTAFNFIETIDPPEEINLFKRVIRTQTTEEPKLRVVRNNVIRDPRGLWPNNTLYYQFQPSEFSQHQKLRIKDALQDLMSETCVRFVERTTEPTFVNIRNTLGCSGNVGYHHNGPMDLYLVTSNCQTRGIIQHEFLHALGFWHEHTRPDRDNYVTVLWDNITPGRESNFYKRNPHETLTLGLPYDYGSVMHYRTNSFSKDRKSPTIVLIDKNITGKIGQRKRFSQIDVAKLNRLYNCSSIFYKAEEFNISNSVHSEFPNIGDLFEPEINKEINSSITATPDIQIKINISDYMLLSIPEIIIKMLNEAIKNITNTNNFENEYEINTEITMFPEIEKEREITNNELLLRGHNLSANKSLISETWNEFTDSLQDIVINISLDILNILYLIYELYHPDT